MTCPETLHPPRAVLNDPTASHPIRAGKLHAALLCALASLVAGASSAGPWFDPSNQDIDLFLVNPATSPARPNVLILLDNTANWNIRSLTRRMRWPPSSMG
jgi:hypothetical protein